MKKALIVIKDGMVVEIITNFDGEIIVCDYDSIDPEDRLIKWEPNTTLKEDEDINTYVIPDNVEEFEVKEELKRIHF